MYTLKVKFTGTKADYTASFEFETLAELEAFSFGLHEAMGWLGYQIIDVKGGLSYAKK